MTPEQQPATKQDLADLEARIVDRLTEAITRTADALTTKQDRAVESIAGEISALRSEIGQRIDAVGERLDNLAPVVISTDARMAAFTRSVDRLIGGHHETAGTLAAQQRAFDQLAARVATLEKAIQEIRPNPPQQ